MGDSAVYMVLIPLLTFLSIMAIGASIIIARRQKKIAVEIRLQDDRWVGISEKEKPQKSNFLNFIAQMGNFVSHGHSKKDLNEQLLRAGYLKSSAPAIYTGVKIMLFIIGLVGIAVLVIPLEISISMKIALVFLGASVLFFLPNFIIIIQLKKQHDEISQHLPEAVDLLEICVSSGIGLDMAWNIVSDEILNVSPILASAMSLTSFEINLGASRTEAMRHMSERTGVAELSSLATILTQTERFGTSIAETLRVFADSMREERVFKAEEHAEKMAVKLIFPMVLFIFPAVLVTLAGPAVITIYQKLILGE
jgi:tight adherence protein C